LRPKNTRAFCIVNEVATRWSSTYMMLQSIVTWKKEIQNALQTLKSQPLNVKPEHWKTIGNLVNLLLPFKLYTDELQSSRHPTIGQGFAAQYRLAAIITGQTTDKVDINKFTPEAKAVVARLRSAFSLRWNTPTPGTILATMLDPRYKNLDFVVDGARKEEHKQWFRNMYTSMAEDLKQMPCTSVPPPTSHSDLLPTAQFFGVAPAQLAPSAEMDQYMRDTPLPLTVDSNPLKWWQLRELTYPVLAQAARRFLCIPVSSASSERVFSAGGNILVRGTKRSRLDNDRICRMIFLKKNDAVVESQTSPEEIKESDY
jgi:hypothetical protein